MTKLSGRTSSSPSSYEKKLYSTTPVHSHQIEHTNLWKLSVHYKFIPLAYRNAFQLRFTILVLQPQLIYWRLTVFLLDVLL